MVALIPASDVDTTGEHIDNALSRRMRSMCGRNGPPKTNCKFKPIYSIKFLLQIKTRKILYIFQDIVRLWDHNYIVISLDNQIPTQTEFIRRMQALLNRVKVMSLSTKYMHIA